MFFTTSLPQVNNICVAKKKGKKLLINLVSGAELYEQAIKYEKASFITSTGALATLSGAKTGRSPKDKRVVKDETIEDDDLWWGKYVFFPNSNLITGNRCRLGVGINLGIIYNLNICSISVCFNILQGISEY